MNSDKLSKLRISALRRNPAKIILSLFIITLTLIIACNRVESKTTYDNLEGTVAENYPLFSASPIGAARFAVLPKDILIRTGEISISRQEIEQEIAGARPGVKEQLEQNAFYLLEQKLIEKVLLAEGRSNLEREGHDVANLSERDLLQTFIAGMLAWVTPTEEEMRDFYAANKELMGGMPYDRVKGQIEMFLTQQMQQEFIQDYILNILQDRDVEIATSWGAEKIALLLDNLVDKARSSGKPSLVNFGSDSCVPCQMMIPAREAVRDKYKERANVVYVHTDRDQILSSRFGIQSIPTLIFYDRNGMEVHRHVGMMEQEEMEEWLNVMLQG